MTAVYATMAARISTDADTWTVPITLSYTADDPVAVTMLIPSDTVTVGWVFARSLLVDGMTTCAGDGDVVVFWLGGDKLSIILAGADGQALVEIPRPAVNRFLRRTYALIPPGREPVDVDAAIAACLAEVQS